jgi:predicted nucleic acid-binding protein
MSVPSAPALLDTSIPMYAAGTPHYYRDACQWVMSEIISGRIGAVLDSELIQEILHRYGALGRHADAVKMARDMMALIPRILPVGEVEMQAAVTLFAQYAPRGVRARDTVHAAVMQIHGLTDVISTDAHFDMIAGVTRLDPIRLYQAAFPSNP